MKCWLVEGDPTALLGQKRSREDLAGFLVERGKSALVHLRAQMNQSEVSCPRIPRQTGRILGRGMSPECLLSLFGVLELY